MNRKAEVTRRVNDRPGRDTLVEALSRHMMAADDWHRLRDTTVVVTGGRGSLGGLLLRCLTSLDLHHGLNLNLVGTARAISSRAPNNLTHWVEWDITRPASELLDRAVSASSDIRVVHCAATTHSKEMIDHPVEVFAGIVEGTRNVLEWSRQVGARRVVYVSSIEVYGHRTSSNEETHDEANLGSVPLDSPRSCYPLAKRAAEHLCHAYRYQYGLESVIARPGPTFGFGTRPDDPRAFAEFARCALAGRDIELHTDGHSIANYCDSVDAVVALIRLLHEGPPGHIYDVVDPARAMTIRQFAQTVAAHLGDGSARVVCHPAPDAARYAAHTANRVTDHRLRGLGWAPTTDLADSLDRMIRAWQTDGDDL